MKNILIIGCGLLGSSLLRRISKKKIAKKIYIYEKSKSNISKIKKLLQLIQMEVNGIELALKKSSAVLLIPHQKLSNQALFST